MLWLIDVILCWEPLSFCVYLSLPQNSDLSTICNHVCIFKVVLPCLSCGAGGGSFYCLLSFCSNKNHNCSINIFYYLVMTPSWNWLVVHLQTHSVTISRQLSKRKTCLLIVRLDLHIVLTNIQQSNGSSSLQTCWGRHLNVATYRQRVLPYYELTHNEQKNMLCIAKC